MAHTLVYLRIAASVTRNGARLTIDLPAQLWSSGICTRRTVNQLSRRHRVSPFPSNWQCQVASIGYTLTIVGFRERARAPG